MRTAQAILKRILKVSHPTLQLFVLKVIKSQVPYCGRKWRQCASLLSLQPSRALFRSASEVCERLRKLLTLKLTCSPFLSLSPSIANMKVITAIYLHCRPDLRDEWLAGVDVDADVEESLVRFFPFSTPSPRN